MGVELAKSEFKFLGKDDADESDSEVYLIRDALNSASLDETGRYDRLVGVMHYSGRLTYDEEALLVTSLKGLAGASSCIDVVLHDSLLSAIFGICLWNHSLRVVEAVLHLIRALAISNGKYIDSCLDMLVSNFVPPFSYINMLKTPQGRTRKDLVLSHVHATLQHIVELAHLAALRLEFIVIQRLPKLMKEPVVAVYVENMLFLERSPIGEFIGKSILTTLVDKLVDLDVDIGWEYILQNDCNKAIFDMELDLDKDTNDVDSEYTTMTPREFSAGCLKGNVVAEMLDSLMKLTLEHIHSCKVSGRLNMVFEILLEAFEKNIMTAYRSKFAQFVIFYACALDPEFCGLRYATWLSSMFLSVSNPPLVRMSAVSYIASFLARGNFLQPFVVASLLKRLVDWCLEFCQTHADGINPDAHRVFYSACQAVMYVLCFRMKSMMEIPELKSQLLLPIGIILTHGSSPLKVCLPSVVEEFLRQAKVSRLFTTSERMLFENLSESDLSRAFGGAERLDTFFPFDPYLLKGSDRYIRPHYTYWSLVDPDYGNGDEDQKQKEDDCDDDSEDDDRSNSDCSKGNAAAYEEDDFDLDGFDSALNSMSITPKKSVLHNTFHKHH